MSLKFPTIPASWEWLESPDGSILFNYHFGTRKHLKLRSPESSFKSLLKLMNGTYSTQELQDQIKDPRVPKWIDHLEKQGIATESWTPSAKLSASERERFESQVEWFRQFETPTSTALSFHQKLSRAKVGIIGLGGTGSMVAMMLAASGVGTLRIIDGDKIESSNLIRQIFYSEEQIGKSKSETLKSELRSLNSTPQFEAFSEFIETHEDAVRALTGLDIVILTADAPRILINRLINQACIATGVPCLHSLSGAVGPLVVPGNSPCFECLEAHRRKITGPDYDQMVSALQVRRTRRYPSFIGGIPGASQLLFMETVGWITQAWTPKSLHGLVTPGTYQNGFEPIERNVNCPLCNSNSGVLV